MNLLIINPNISTSVTTLIEREARLSASADTELTLLTAPFGVAYIETRAEACIGGYAVLQELAQHYPGHQAAIVAAFGDPGLEAAREALPIPVVGLTEASLMTAAQLGSKIGIIAISGRIKPWYAETVVRYGMQNRLAGIRSLDESIRDIAQVQTDQTQALLTLCQQAIEADGADVLIIAGAPLAGLARNIKEQIPVPLVDGVSCAVRQAELLARLALDKAQQGSYAPPPRKPCSGLTHELAQLVGGQPLNSKTQD